MSPLIRKGNVMFGSKGLIKSNIKAYFKARSKGVNVDDALNAVIDSRYPLSESKRESVRNEFKSRLSSPPILDRSDSERRKVKELVRAILFFEYPRAETKYSFSLLELKRVLKELLWEPKSLFEVLRVNFEDLRKITRRPVQEAFY